MKAPEMALTVNVVPAAVVRRRALREIVELAVKVSAEPGLSSDAVAALLGFSSALQKLHDAQEPVHG